MKHAFFSASQAHRWIPCTASMNHDQTSPATPVMEEGIKAHELCELMLKDKEYDKNKYTDEMIKHAKGYVEYINRIR